MPRFKRSVGQTPLYFIVQTFDTLTVGPVCRVFYIRSGGGVLGVCFVTVERQFGGEKVEDGVLSDVTHYSTTSLAYLSSRSQAITSAVVYNNCIPTTAASAWTRQDTTVAVAKRLDRSPLTEANQVLSPAGSLPDFREWGSCRTMLLVGGFCRGSPDSPCPFIPALLHTHLTSPSSALKTSMISQCTKIRTAVESVLQIDVYIRGMKANQVGRCRGRGSTCAAFSSSCSFIIGSQSSEACQINCGAVAEETQTFAFTRLRNYPPFFFFQNKSDHRAGHTTCTLRRELALLHSKLETGTKNSQSIRNNKLQDRRILCTSFPEHHVSLAISHNSAIITPNQTLCTQLCTQQEGYIRPVIEHHEAECSQLIRKPRTGFDSRRGRLWESYRTMPPVGGFSRRSPVPPNPWIQALLHTHIISSSSALKASMLRVVQDYQQKSGIMRTRMRKTWYLVLRLCPNSPEVHTCACLSTEVLSELQVKYATGTNTRIVVRLATLGRCASGAGSQRRPRKQIPGPAAAKQRVNNATTMALRSANNLLLRGPTAIKHRTLNAAHSPPNYAARRTQYCDRFSRQPLDFSPRSSPAERWFPPPPPATHCPCIPAPIRTHLASPSSTLSRTTSKDPTSIFWIRFWCLPSNQVPGKVKNKRKEQRLCRELRVFLGTMREHARKVFFLATAGGKLELCEVWGVCRVRGFASPSLSATKCRHGLTRRLRRLGRETRRARLTLHLSVCVCARACVSEGLKMASDAPPTTIILPQPLLLSRRGTAQLRNFEFIERRMPGGLLHARRKNYFVLRKLRGLLYPCYVAEIKSGVSYFFIFTGFLAVGDAARHRITASAPSAGDCRLSLRERGADRLLIARETPAPSSLTTVTPTVFRSKYLLFRRLTTTPPPPPPPAAVGKQTDVVATRIPLSRGDVKHHRWQWQIRPTRVIEVSVERRRIERTGETEDPEETRRPTASSGTIPTCENPLRGLEFKNVRSHIPSVIGPQLFYIPSQSYDYRASKQYVGKRISHKRPHSEKRVYTWVRQKYLKPLRATPTDVCKAVSPLRARRSTDVQSFRDKLGEATCKPGRSAVGWLPGPADTTMRVCGNLSRAGRPALCVCGQWPAIRREWQIASLPIQPYPSASRPTGEQPTLARHMVRRLLTSYLGEPGSTLGGVAPGFSRVLRFRWSPGFLGDLSFDPLPPSSPIHSGATPYSPLKTAIAPRVALRDEVASPEHSSDIGRKQYDDSQQDVPLQRLSFPSAMTLIRPNRTLCHSKHFLGVLRHCHYYSLCLSLSLSLSLRSPARDGANQQHITLLNTFLLFRYDDTSAVRTYIHFIYCDFSVLPLQHSQALWTEGIPPKQLSGQCKTIYVREEKFMVDEERYFRIENILLREHNSVIRTNNMAKVKSLTRRQS
ncbi:hypothetical protein PR048_000221 [Dryococelus australis]|uniref:Uncharacterized protein n=1 Tax=Dryococelus australis TaxID=614101 RepID=A0ABQ9IE33_9NEOP|nr:hypothetical protein PR048_000221 [Dryococelus australis]